MLGAGRAAAALAAVDEIHPEADERELAAGLLVARASCLIVLKRFSEAVEPLQRYLQDLPEGPEAAACSARLIVARAESGDDEAAMQAYERFRSQFSGHTLILPTTEYLADRAAAKKQWDAARGLYQVLADNRESPDYAAKGLAGLGKMQLKTGSAEDSAKTFETLLDKAPEGPQAAEAAFLRARSLESSDRWEEALEAYRAVIDRFPTTAQAPQALLACAQLQELAGQITLKRCRCWSNSHSNTVIRPRCPRHSTRWPGCRPINSVRRTRTRHFGVSRQTMRGRGTGPTPSIAWRSGLYRCPTPRPRNNGSTDCRRPTTSIRTSVPTGSTCKGSWPSMDINGRRPCLPCRGWPANSAATN